MNVKAFAALAFAGFLVSVVGGAGVAAFQAREVELDFPARTDSAPAITDVDIRYLADVRRNAVHIGNADDDTLLNAGRALCQAIRPLNPVRRLESAEVSGYDLRVVVSAATTELCPDLRPQVRSYLAGTR